MKIESMALGPVATNTYLISSADGKTCCVIDAPKGAAEALLPIIQQRGLKLTHLIITHGHWDHTCDAHRFAKVGAAVIAHREDEVLIEQIEKFRARYQSFLPMLTEDDFRAVKVSQWVNAGDTLDIAGYHFEVRHVPGHCPGSILLYEASAHLAFTGDAIFEGSVGRTDLPNGNWTQLLKSIREQIYTLPDNTVLLPGHGGSTTVGQEKQTNPYARP